MTKYSRTHPECKAELAGRMAARRCQQEGEAGDTEAAGAASELQQFAKGCGHAQRGDSENTDALAQGDRQNACLSALGEVPI